MMLSAFVIRRLAFGLIIAMAPFLHAIPAAGERALPYPAAPIPGEPRANRETHPPPAEGKHPAGAEHVRMGLAFPQPRDYDGMLAPSMDPAVIDPAAAPPEYLISAVVSYNHGVHLYNEGKVSQALEEWKTARRIQPALPEAHYALSLVSHHHGDEKDAMFHAITARAQRSDWATAYHLGVMHYEAGDFTQASHYFREAAQRHPNDALALNALGLSQLREGYVPDAAQALTMASTWNPNLPHIRHNLGLAFFARQEWEHATTQFEETLRLDPTLAGTHYWAGLTQAATGRWTQAIASWQRAVALDQHHPQRHLVYYNLGTAYWMTGNPIDARQAYRMALRDHPVRAQVYYQLGVIDMALSQWDKAHQLFLTASRLAPDWEQPYFNLGLVRYNQGLIDGAREAFQQAVTLQPDFTDAHYHLGLTLRIMQHDRHALMAFERAADAGHLAAQETLAGMYANGRGITRNLAQAMRWWHRASRGPQGDQAADHARAQLSRLRQWYFAHRDHGAYARELLDGFEAIQRDIRQDQRHANHDALDSFQGASIGMTLASAGRVTEAVPLLVGEAYALNADAHAYLEFLIREGMLNGTPAQRAQVITYFTDTASEGLADSCRFLSAQHSPSERNRPRLQPAHGGPESCRSLLP